MNETLKRKILIISFLLLTVIFLFFIILNNKKNKMNTFDVNSENVDYIDDFLINLESNLKEKNIDFVSEKAKNKDIYSILVVMEDSDEDIKSNNYLSYNINIKTKKVMNNEEVANSFGYSLDDIFKAINKRLEDLYQDEIKEGFVEKNECDFECYKSYYRGIENIEDIYSLYVKDNKLYIYVSIKVISAASDEDYFKKLNYNPYKIEL